MAPHTTLAPAGVEYLKHLGSSADKTIRNGRAADSQARPESGGRRSSEGSSPASSRPASTNATPRRDDDLHVCPSCNSDLVYPTDWAPASERQWHVALRCPECEWNGGGRYRQDVVDRLDEALDHGTESVLDDLNVLIRANMEDQIERFAAALQADQILPEDF